MQQFPISFNHLVPFKNPFKRTVVHKLEDPGELKKGSWRLGSWRRTLPWCILSRAFSLARERTGERVKGCPATMYISYVHSMLGTLLLLFLVTTWEVPMEPEAPADGAALRHGSPVLGVAPRLSSCSQHRPSWEAPAESQRPPSERCGLNPPPPPTPEAHHPALVRGCEACSTAAMPGPGPELLFPSLQHGSFICHSYHKPFIFCIITALLLSMLCTNRSCCQKRGQIGDIFLLWTPPSPLLTVSSYCSTPGLHHRWWCAVTFLGTFTF